MNEKIGIILCRLREEKKITRKQICDGLISENEYRNIEIGKSEGEVWLQKLLIGRLHIPESAVTFYLSKKENEMVNLEMEIYRRVMIWRYQEAEEKLKLFYDMINKESRIQMLIYYKLYLLVYGQRRKLEEAEFEIMNKRLGNMVSEIEKKLYEREILSPDELSFISEYFANSIIDEYERSKRLYEVLDYYKYEYSGMECGNRFYAQLNYYYAQGQYNLREYQNCVESCKEGLKVTALFGNCNNTAELFELLADAEGRILESETSLIVEKKVSQVKKVVENYTIAMNIYAIFDGEEADRKKKTVEDKVAKWKTMLFQ